MFSEKVCIVLQSVSAAKREWELPNKKDYSTSISWTDSETEQRDYTKGELVTLDSILRSMTLLEWEKAQKPLQLAQERVLEVICSRAKDIWSLLNTQNKNKGIKTANKSPRTLNPTSDETSGEGLDDEDVEAKIDQLDSEIEELQRKYEMELGRVTATVDENLTKLRQSKPQRRKSITGDVISPRSSPKTDRNTHSPESDSDGQSSNDLKPSQEVKVTPQDKNATLPHRLKATDLLAPRNQSSGSIINNTSTSSNGMKSKIMRDNSTISSPIKNRKSVSSIFDSNLNQIYPHRENSNQNFSTSNILARADAAINPNLNKSDASLNSSNSLSKINKTGVELMELLKQDDVKMERLQNVVKTMVDDVLKDMKKLIKEKPLKESGNQKSVRKSLKKNLKDSANKAKLYFADVCDGRKRTELVMVLTLTIKLLNQYFDKAV